MSGQAHEREREQNCISTTDADGNITKSCCHVLQDGGRYMVAYKNLTPGGLTGFQARLRWILSKRWHRRCIMTISALSAGERRRAKRNGLAVSRQNQLLPVYADDLEEWQDKTNNTQSYPVERRNRAEWTLPVWIFGKDFSSRRLTGKWRQSAMKTSPACLRYRAFRAERGERSV